MQPLENQDTIIFKLPIGYITSANLFIDLVNIDNTNNLFEFETNDNTKYSFRIQSKMYSTIEEVIEVFSQELTNIGFSCTFENMSLTFSEPIKIIENNFTEFIGLIVGDTYDYIAQSNISTYHLSKNTLPQPSILYANLSTNLENSENILKNFENIQNGKIELEINYQNDYENLFLTFSSNTNSQPLKFNLSSTLNVIS